MKLYELTQKYAEVLEMAQFDPELVADTLESLEDAIQDKAENTAKIIKSLEGENLAIDEEIKRLSEMKRVRKNSVENLKNYLRDQLEMANIDKVKGALFTVRIQKNPAKLVLRDDFNSDSYLIPQPPKVDTNKIKELLKQGEEIEGASLIQEMSLRIK